MEQRNGDARAAEDIQRLNELIGKAAAGVGATLLPFHDTLVDSADPSGMAAGLTDDGDHPSIAGHRLLGELVARRAASFALGMRWARRLRK